MTQAIASAQVRPSFHRTDSVRSGNTLQLILSTGAFIVCFAVFGCVAAMTPAITERFGLTEAQVGVVLAIPVLLGSLGRIPLGMLTDRLGGRRVHLAVMSFSLLPAIFVPYAHSYSQLLFCAFLLGVPLAIFPVGVAFVSDWYPPRRQGTALGMMGMGNLGQCIALFGAPILAAHFGYQWAFWTYAALLLAWLAVFFTFAHDAPRKQAPKNFRDFLQPLANPLSWMLSLFYFVTFGGFLAMAAYLPKFLTLTFHLAKPDAGFRAAGFVLLATCMRPVGGLLADRIGGRTILRWVFITTAFAAVLMSCPYIPTFTLGALGMAAAIGLGNGAIFKLVPEYFPDSVGSVTGIVGAAGGLGGFFPPLLLGILRQYTGSFTLGFLLLSLFSLSCLLVLNSGKATSPK